MLSTLYCIENPQNRPLNALPDSLIKMTYLAPNCGTENQCIKCSSSRKIGYIALHAAAVSVPVW